MFKHQIFHCGGAANSNAGQLRVLHHTEISLYYSHLARLSRQCRRSRFGNEVSDQFLADYVDRIDLTNTVIVGYLDGEQLHGGAELRSLRKAWCKAAEVAFSVDAQWRSRGIGSALMMDALFMAQALGVERTFLICNRNNRAMQRIAEKVHADIHFEDGDCLAVIVVPRLQAEAICAVARCAA